VVSEVAGRLCYVAAQGKAVRQGEVIFVVDPAPYQEELNRREAELQAKAADAARTAARIPQVQNENAEKLLSPTRDMEQAQRLLAKYAQGDQPAQEMNMQQAVADARWVLATEEKQFKERDNLLADGSIGEREFLDVEVRMNRAKSNLQAAELRLKGHVEFEKPYHISQFEWSVRATTNALAATRGACDAALAQAQAEAAAAAAALADATAKRDAARAALAKTAIPAAADGPLQLADPARVALGQTVAPGQHLANVGQ
jgi:multidrug resistance efflux pump